jgi:lysophospholipase L1-like esterase
MAHLIVFGDSLVYGCWDEEGGWVQRLRKYLDKLVVGSNFELYFMVYNLGLSDETTETLVKRFDDEIKPRLSEEEENLIILAVGINDSEFFHKNNCPRVSEAKFKANLGKLIDQAKKYTDKIIFIGLTPVDDAKVDPIPWSPDYSYRNKQVKEYNHLIKAVCEKQKIPFLDLLPDLGKDFNQSLVDGVHLNHDGHKILFKKVLDALRKFFPGFLPTTKT